MTEFLMGIECEQIIRGYDVDPDIRPDAEFVMDGVKWYGELDTGSCCHKQVRDRFKVYETVDAPVVWVFTSEARTRNVMATAQKFQIRAYFTTLRGDWLDIEGNKL